jgi:hypothetical protein
VYSLGESETLVGNALKALSLPRDQVIVATKSTGMMGEEPNRRGQSRHHIVNEVDASLRRLQLDHIDLYQLHGFDPLTPFDESLRCARRYLVSAGKIRTLGICNMAAWQVMKALALSDQARLGTLRERAGLLHHRRPGPRARTGAADAGPGSRLPGLEPAGRWPALGQVQGRRQRPRGRTADAIRLPGGRQGPCIQLHRGDAADRCGAWVRLSRRWRSPGCWPSLG